MRFEERFKTAGRVGLIAAARREGWAETIFYKKYFLYFDYSFNNMKSILFNLCDIFI